MTTLKNKKGVSLVELIAVIVIMGIIATVGGISVATIIENSNKSAAQQALVDVMTAGKNYLNANPDKDCVALADLETSLEKTTYAKVKSLEGSLWVCVNAGKTEFTFSSTNPVSGSTYTYPAATDVTVQVGKYDVKYTKASGTYETSPHA